MFLFIIISSFIVLSHSFLGSGVQIQLSWVLFLDCVRLQSRCQPGVWSRQRFGVLFQALIVDIISFLATVELMSTCFFKASRRTPPLQLLTSGNALKVSSGLIKPTLPFGLIRQLSLVIDSKTLMTSAKSLYHLCHSQLVRSEFLVMPALKRGGDYARVSVIRLILEFANQHRN